MVATAPYILAPLYFYPTSNAWLPLLNAVQKNPTLTFSVVVNINSGPGGPANSWPDASWITTINQLNGYNNTQLLGYVHTSRATRDISDTLADIDAFASWGTYTTQDIHMDGIFFDESPDIANSSTVPYMTNITNYARNQLALPNLPSPSICFNPGTPVDDTFYNLADIVIALEDTYASYGPLNNGAASIGAVPTRQRAKSAFVIHDFTGTSIGQSNTINSITGGAIPGVYITTMSDYNGFSSLWTSFVNAMAAAKLGTGSTSASSAAATSTQTSAGTTGITTRSITSTLATTLSTILVTTSSTATATATGLLGLGIGVAGIGL